MDPDETPKTAIQKIQERLAASRFFTVSLLLHMGIIIIGGGVVLFKQMADPPDFDAGGDGLVGEEAATAGPAEPAPATEQMAPQTPNLTAPSMEAITSLSATPSFAVANVAPVSIAMPSESMAKVGASLGAKGLTGLPGSMNGRVGGTNRAAALKKNGGTEKSELAVLAGLRWLVKTQKSDGSWSDAHKPAMTGLALLSFLGHGETTVSAEFGPTVGRAVDWILDNGKKNSGRLSMEGSISQEGSYSHGIVTYALGEYVAMTKDERAIDLFKQAIKYIVDGQGPDGGWMYNYNKEASDTSVTGWQIQALKAAYLSGYGEGVDVALDKAMGNLKRVQGPAGGFGYRGPEDKYSLTGVGVLCTLFWKQEKDKSVNEGIKFMGSQLAANPVEYKHATANLYAWYYNTQACLMFGEPAWSKWNGLFQNELIKNQAPDGSWPPMTDGSHGNLQKDEAGAGPYYRTTLCILMLESYYRYSPSLGGHGGSLLDKKAGSSLDKKPGA